MKHSTESKYLGEILEPILKHHAQIGFNKYIGLLRLNLLRYRLFSSKKLVYHYYRIKEEIQVHLTTKIEKSKGRIAQLESELAVLNDELGYAQLEPSENEHPIPEPFKSDASKILALVEFINPKKSTQND